MESHWPHRMVKRSLFSLAVSNGGSICLWYLYVYICTGICLYFLISWLFQRALIDHIEQQRGHSVLWQFQMGGGHHLSLSHQLTVSNGFSLMAWIHTELTHFHWQFYMGGRTSPVTFLSMTVLNGFSLTVWIRAELTHFHWQFHAGGRTSAKVGLSAKLSSFKFCSCFTELFHFLKEMKDQSVWAADPSSQTAAEHSSIAQMVTCDIMYL